MCCLEYENEPYSEAYKKMPKVGSEVTTPDGKSTVISNNMLKMTVKTRAAQKDGTLVYKDYDLKDVKFNKQKKVEKDDDESSVNLMTMHASKGLEFKVVFLSGIEDNIIPSARALEENMRNIDEERRLFYVAITRAKEKLFINYALTRRDREGKEKSVLPSRFIEEIPTALLQSEE